MKFFKDVEDCLAASLPLTVGAAMCFLDSELSENTKLAVGLFFLSGASFLAKKTYDFATDNNESNKIKR